MDKIMGLLTVIFVGLPLTIISMILSWWMNDEGMDKEQHIRDNSCSNVSDNDTDMDNSVMGDTYTTISDR